MSLPSIAQKPSSGNSLGQRASQLLATSPTKSRLNSPRGPSRTNPENECRDCEKETLPLSQWRLCDPCSLERIRLSECLNCRDSPHPVDENGLCPKCAASPFRPPAPAREDSFSFWMHSWSDQRLETEFQNVHGMLRSIGASEVTDWVMEQLTQELFWRGISPKPCQCKNPHCFYFE